MKYLERKSLREVPGFKAAIQLKTITNNEQVFIGLRDDALAVFAEKGRQYFFDLEGRPWRMSTLNWNIQRGLSHQGIRMRKRERQEGGGFERVKLTPDELKNFCRSMHDFGNILFESLKKSELNGILFAKPDYDTARKKIEQILMKISSNTPEQLEREAIQFRAVYQPIPILPPDHYRSLVLQATEGCPYNTCTFCSLYRANPFRIKSTDEFITHIKKVIKLHGNGLLRRSAIFLGEANATAIPTEQLLSLIKQIHEHFVLPSFEARPVKPSWGRGKKLHFNTIGAFIDGFTGLKKTASDYRALYEAGLERVYLGVESGSDNLLEWIAKPATTEEMKETVRRLKKGGLKTDIIIIVGLGGKRFQNEHVEATKMFFKSSPLEPGDRVYFSDIVESSDAPYGKRMQQEGIESLGEKELSEQRLELQNAAKSLDLQPVVYRIEPFIY